MNSEAVGPIISISVEGSRFAISEYDEQIGPPRKISFAPKDYEGPRDALAISGTLNNPGSSFKFLATPGLELLVTGQIRESLAETLPGTQSL